MKLTKPMTKAGYQRLAEEFNKLRNQERPKVVQGVADAAAEGDRSENAEYIYGKKRLREIDKRLRYLSGLIKDVQIIDSRTLSGEQICFASTAVVEDIESGARKSYRLVGVGEADAGAGDVSWLSPVGKAMMGKKVGDIFEVERPAGIVSYEVLEIKFS